MRGLLVVLSLAGVAPAQPPLRQSDFTFMATNSVLRWTSKNEAMASVRVWMEMIARRRGVQVNSRFIVCESQAELERAVAAGSISLAYLDVLEYLSLPRPQLLDVLFVHAAQEERRHLLVVRQAAGMEQPADLKGKSLGYYSWSHADLGRRWLEVLLHDQGLGPLERHFASLTAFAKPSAACLPVFFGKLDACLIDQQSFRVLTEMNPQMASRLKVIAESPAYLEAVVAVHSGFQSERETLVSGLRELHQDPEGRQILLAFRGDRIVQVPPSRLNSVRELYRRSLAISGSASGLRREASR